MQCKWSHLVAKFANNPRNTTEINFELFYTILFYTILTEIFIQVMESIVNTLGPLCLWQCFFFNFPLIYSTLKMAVKERWHALTCVTHSVTVRDRSISISSSAVLLKQP